MSFLKNSRPLNSIDDYLDHIFDAIDPNIKLDREQKEAVISDSKYSLIIAGAGTGKTTTVAAKVKYLVDIKHIAPEKILVMSYTKKATEELRRRINVDFDIPADITTFHSLGYRYLRLLNPDKKLIPLDNNRKDEIFLSFLKENIFPNQNRLNEMVELFNDNEIHWEDVFEHTYGNFFKENYKDYPDFDSYFNAYIKKKVSETKNITQKVIDITDSKVNSELPRTIKNERVKSKGEAVIANFLYCNNIDYTYEKVYDELIGDFKQIYRPDFTIDVGGEKIYIEYFGLSGNNLDNNSYSKIRRQKEAYHHEKHHKFIALDYKPNRKYLEDLKNQLESYGVILRPKSNDEVYRRLLENNPLAEFFSFKNFLYETIETIKNSEKVRSSKDVKTICAQKISTAHPSQKGKMQRQYEWIAEFWRYYDESRIKENGEAIDFNDMIKKPTPLLNNLEPNLLKYDYIIVDEYQDISVVRYELLRATVDRCNAKLMVVGDDWQSIYSFMGGKIRYIYDFNFFFPNAKKYYITKTYRNSQSLIDCAGEFIMRNKSQVKKTLVSDKNQINPISIIGCKKEDSVRMLKIIIKSIHQKYPRDSILTLCHNNFTIRQILYDPELRDSAENKVAINGVPNFYFDLMTIHKSKGLTYDWIIIMPLSNRFPHNPLSKFWVNDLFRNNPEQEQIEYPEFRRLFYVALTRGRKKVIIICDEQKYRRSRYINEIEAMIKT